MYGYAMADGKTSVRALFPNVIKYEPSLYFQQLCDLGMSTRMFSPLRSKLRYSPDLALTLMSARMRGARLRTCSYTSRRDIYRNKADGLYRT